MGRKRKQQRQKVEIVYPPVTTRKWIPPYLRKKKRVPKPPPYPPQLTSKITPSSLKKVWHGYEIIHDCAVLRGHYSQMNRRFRYISCGYQGAANCVMAVLFSKLIDCAYWNDTMLDTILNWGDRYYVDCQKRFKEKQCLRLGDLNRELYLYSYKIFIDFRGDRRKVLLYDDCTEQESLQNAIKEFFQSYETGVLSTAGMPGRYFAIWKHGGGYFLFDPTDHDKMCWPVKGIPGNGYSFVVRFTNTDKLVQVVQRNLQATNTEVEISPVGIERIVMINTRYPDCVEDANLEAMDTKLAKLNREDSIIIKKQPVDVVEVEPEIVLPEEDQDPDDLFEEGVAAEEEEGVEGMRKIQKRRVLVEKPRVASITYFNYVIPDRIGILLAETHQNDPDFLACPEKQGLSNAVAALVMLRQLRAKCWSSRVLTQVLRLGYRICRETKRAIAADQEINLKTILKRIVLNERSYTPHITQYGAVGRLKSKDDAIVELYAALKEVLSECDTVVVQGPLVVAVFRQGGLFYMFDPNERDPNGFAIVKEIRVGSVMEAVDFIGGVACLTWFIDLKDLVDVYMANIPFEFRRDPFIVSNVEIKDYVELPENWGHFKAIAEDRWILRGNFSQADRKFERESRNTQCTANCIMAIAYAHAIPIADWTSETMDTILLCGNDYYMNCIEELRKRGKFVSPMLMLVELMTEFVANNKLAMIDVSECVVNGFIAIKDQYKNTLNLKKGLTEFFKDNTFGVLTCRGTSVAVFKKGEAYFYFDSHDRDDQGFCKPHGKCCVQRFTNTEKMGEIIMGNLGPDVFAAIYNLSRIDVALFDAPPPNAPKDEDDDDDMDILDPEGDQQMTLRDIFNVELPYYHYEKITKKRAILRSSFHQGDEHFAPNADKQTVPNLLSAVVTARVFDPKLWDRERLDEVLNRGNDLYEDSMDLYYKAQAKRNLREEADEDDNDAITIENVAKEMKIGINKFTIEQETVTEGTLDVEATGISQTIESLLKEDAADVNDYKEVIIHTDMYDVIVWKQDGIYYLFDPRARNDRGEIFGKEEWSEYEEPIAEEDYEDATDADEEIELANMNLEGEVEEEEQPIGQEAIVQYLEQEWRAIGEQEEEEVAEEEVVIPKHPQEYWDDLQERTGRACVVWFTKLKLLVKHLVGNNPPKLRDSLAFKIVRVHLTNDPDVKDTYDPAEGEKEDPIQGDWHHFSEITMGVWILRGSMNQKHPLFPENNRGKQGDANSLLACAFAALYGISQFNSRTIDEMLKYGDRLYTHTKNLRRRELEALESVTFTEAEIDEIVKAERYTVENLVKNMCIGDDSIAMAVEAEPITGEVHAQDLEDVLDVKRAVDLFFGSPLNQYAVLSAKGLTVAIWKIREFYYMFDPEERGPHGNVFENGVACIVRFTDIGPMVELFLANLPKMGKNFFTLFGVQGLLGMCNKPIKVETLHVDDPLKVIGFTPVARGKMIIRGTIHQDLPRFGRGINMQCSPIAMVALAMSLLHSTEFWTSLIVDDVIVIGDKIYGELLERCDFDFNPWEEKLSVSMSPKDFKIGRIKVNCETKLTEQRGTIDTKEPQMQNLRRGIEKFFEENSYGVVETTFLTVAIWQPENCNDTNYLYMFDPNQRSQTGQPVQENGSGCIMKFCGPKYLSDHIISLVSHDREGTYVITPIEIVIERDGKYKKTKRYGADRALEMRPDSHKHKLLGRNTFYQVPNSQFEILRGTRSQSSKCYSEYTRGFQDIPNCIVAYVMDKLIPMVRWSCKTIDMILDIGDQLYKCSYLVYDPKDKKLRIETLVRDIVIRDVSVSISVGAPIIAAQFQMRPLMEGLEACFNLKQFCIVIADQSGVAIFKKDESFFLFDPMDLDLGGNRVEKGSAAVLRFEDLAVMVIHLMKNMQANGVKDRFYIVVVGIKEIKKVGFKFGEPHRILRPTEKCLCDTSVIGHVKKKCKSKPLEDNVFLSP